MTAFAVALSWALQLYFWLLIARFVIDLTRGINPAFRPRGFILALLEIIMTLTDPPLKLVRRFIKPVRVGNVALDFGWTIVLFAVSILQSLVLRLF